MVKRGRNMIFAASERQCNDGKVIRTLCGYALMFTGGGIAPRWNNWYHEIRVCEGNRQTPKIASKKSA